MIKAYRHRTYLKLKNNKCSVWRDAVHPSSLAKNNGEDQRPGLGETVIQHAIRFLPVDLTKKMTQGKQKKDEKGFAENKQGIA